MGGGQNLNKLEVIYKKTSDLLPYVNNARTHKQSQIKKLASSILEFGFNNPILIDEKAVIIAGHGRLLAAEKLKMESVPCVVLAHLTDIQRKAFILADNRIAMDSGWDEDLLKIEMASLSDFDLSLTGFDVPELETLLNVKNKKFLTDEDAVPEKPQPVAALGDVYELGDHRLMCGDSTKIESVKILCNNRLVDMLLTDPPYNVAYTGKTKDSLTIQNDSMSNDSFRMFLKDSFVAADAVMKEGAVFYVWHADSEGFNFRGACIDAGWKVRQCLIWHKNSMVMGRQDYHWKHEPCLYGWKEGAAHLWATDRKQTTILNFDKPQKNTEHPTMKPVALFEYQMLNNTKGKDIVMDLFGGSGTTLIAAEKSGRVAYLMELDPVYCDVIIKRWEDFTGKKAVKL